MTCRIAQSSEYAGNGYWRWSTWLEGSDSELAAVAKVVWILHPTFEQSRVVRANRARKFRLNRSGWGTFLLRAEVILENGEEHLLKHRLQFESPEKEAPSKEASSRDVSSLRSGERRKPTLFLSYSAQDSRKAAELRERFAKGGFEVLDQTRVATGEPWKESLQKMLSSSDAVIGLVSDDEIGPWVRAEIEAAGRAEKPAIALLMTPESASAGIPKNAKTLPVEQFDSAIAELLRSTTEP